MGIPAVLVWARYIGLGPGIAERVAQELSRWDWEVAVERVRFDIFHGFVAEGLAVRPKFAGQSKAQVSRLVITPDLARLLRGKVEILRVSCAGAEAKLDLWDDGKDTTGPPLVIEGLRGDIWIHSDHLRIPSLSGRVQGIDIELEALLAQSGSKEESSEQTGGISESRDMAREVITRLSLLRFPQRAPRLRATLRGSLEAPAIPHFEIAAAVVEGEGWRLEGAEIAGSWDGERGRIDRLVLRDSVGSLQAWVGWDANLVEIEGTCDLDPAPWIASATAAGSVLREIVWHRPPSLAFRARLDPRHPRDSYLVTAEARAREVQFRDVKAESLGAKIAAKPGTLLLRDVKVVSAAAGRVAGDFLWKAGVAHLRAAGLIEPAALKSALPSDLQHALALFEFRQPAAFQIALQGPGGRDWHGAGLVKLGRSAMRGAWMDSVESHLRISPGAVEFENLKATQDGESATGSVLYDYGQGLVRLQNVRSRINPVDVLMWAEPEIAEILRPYRFVRPPQVSAEGAIDLRRAKRNLLDVQIDAPQGMRYELLGKTLLFGNLAGTVRMRGTQLNISVPSGELFQGQVRFDARISLDPAKPVWEAQVGMEGVNFPSLTKTYFGYASSEGLASGRFAFRSKLGQELDMEGQGYARVDRGNVFDIPLFGPLSELISKVLPGIGYETARVAKADFTVSERRVRTRNLVIEGRGFSLFGEGWVAFPDGEMDMSVRLNARGVPGIVLLPVSKLLEYTSDGTFSDPRWRPKIIPRLPLPGATP